MVFELPYCLKFQPNIRRRIEELHKAVEAAEQYGQDAVNALEEERKRSVELEEKISQQVNNTLWTELQNL